jgi:hypothetical protein
MPVAHVRLRGRDSPSVVDDPALISREPEPPSLVSARSAGAMDKDVRKWAQQLNEPMRALTRWRRTECWDD